MELITPPLDGMILPGVTRDSVLTLAREHVSGKKKLPGLPDGLVVSERPITMSEVAEASKSGDLVELFGAGSLRLLRPAQMSVSAFVTGTACVICPVDRVGYLGEDVHIPTGPDGMGPVSKPIWQELTGRQMGNIQSDWSMVVTE
jgi:branched-chain amino acid aminotransferase